MFQQTKLLSKVTYIYPSELKVLTEWERGAGPMYKFMCHDRDKKVSNIFFLIFLQSNVIVFFVSYISQKYFITAIPTILLFDQISDFSNFVWVYINLRVKPRDNQSFGDTFHRSYENNDRNNCIITWGYNNRFVFFL